MNGDNLAQGCVVLAGCGTSGRLAALLAGSFNEILQEKGDFPVFKYCLAGGDAALVKSGFRSYLIYIHRRGINRRFRRCWLRRPKKDC